MCMCSYKTRTMKICLLLSFEIFNTACSILLQERRGWILHTLQGCVCLSLFLGLIISRAHIVKRLKHTHTLRVADFQMGSLENSQDIWFPLSWDHLQLLLTAMLTVTFTSWKMWILMQVQV